MNSRSPLLPALVALILALGLGSCHSSRRVSGASGDHRHTATHDVTERSVDPDAARTLIQQARRWLGTPYRYGGNERSGVDCSGLTCRVFADGLGIRLPRTSAQQRDYCRRIDRADLEPGDLVFFRNGGKINHVGLYIGAGRMIHASSSRGVIETDLSDTYWARRYYTSGRVEATTYASRGTPTPDGKRPRKRSKAATPPPGSAPARPAPRQPLQVIGEISLDSLAAPTAAPMAPTPTQPAAPSALPTTPAPQTTPQPAPAPRMQQPEPEPDWFD